MANQQSHQKEFLRQKLGQKLNSDSVKLWLPPYTQENGEKGETPNELIEKFSKDLGMSAEDVSEGLEHLRQHALEKLAAKNKFVQSGLASLKIKVAGNVPEQFRQINSSLNITLETSLKVSGSDLKNAISQKLGLEALKLKLIANGGMVEDQSSLEGQRIKHMTSVMVLVLTDSEAEARRNQDQAAGVAKTRRAAEYLSNFQNEDNKEDSEYFLQIADQSGKKIELPNEERRALTLAMTLHEKGRAAMRRKLYSEAVLLLLEADSEFKKCRASILSVVDNYALVCLDLVWCYLCLRNVDSLPDAEDRLKSCDDCFVKSYGPNLERLTLIKGSTGVEYALFARLHLLQGILAYHQHKSDQARALLGKAQQELQRLNVDDDKMAQVMEMGYTCQEARLGLRARDGDTQMAISYILQKREEKENLRKEEKEKRRARRLGKTANGEDVNMAHYANLQAMGFAKGVVTQALKQTNNDIMAAIQVLHEHPEFLDLPDPEPKKVKVTDEMIAQVTAMGFDPSQARAALHHFNADVSRSLEELLQSQGMVPQAWHEMFTAAVNRISPDSSPIKSPEEMDLEQEAMDTIIPDLPSGEQDHLDLELAEENQFLKEYIALLSADT